LRPNPVTQLHRAPASNNPHSAAKANLPAPSFNPASMRSASARAAKTAPRTSQKPLDSRIGIFLIHDLRRAKEAAGMALSDDLRQRVVRAVVDGGLSRNAAAKRFGVSIASAVRWVARFKATGGISLVQLAGIAVPIASRPIAIICLVSFAVINGDVQLARRFDSFLLPRWMAGKEFEQLVLAIVCRFRRSRPSITG
jgi:hypothetical protein